MKADQTIPKNIDEYIAGFPQDIQEVLEKIRATIRKAAPDAEEAISYGMPAFSTRHHVGPKVTSIGKLAGKSN